MVVWWPSNWRICIPLLASMVILTAQLSPLCVQNCNRSEVTGHLALVGTREGLSMSFSGGDAQIKWMPVYDLVIDPLWFQEDQCCKTGLAKLALTGLPLIKMSNLKLLQYLEGAKADLCRDPNRGPCAEAAESSVGITWTLGVQVPQPWFAIRKWRVGKAGPFGELPHWLLWGACHQILHCVNRTNAWIAI